MTSIRDLDRSVAGEIYTSDESWRVLRALCMFGGRSAGTESERLAVAYMRDRLEAYGLENSHLEPFEFLGWKRGTSKLEVTAPRWREVPCIGQAYSASAEVEAELISCEWGHPDVFAALGDRVKGKIALLRTRPSHEAIPGKALQETDTERYARAVHAGAVGYLNWNQIPGRSAMVRTMHYGNIPGEIPAAGLSHADGHLLMEMMADGPVTLRMTEQHSMAQYESPNVVAEIPGTTKADEIVLVGAHHDGREFNQGALNDASGAAVVMEAARALARHKGDFKRTIKVVLFSCELYGLRGSFAYVDQHRDELSRIRLMFNLDAAGRPGGSGLGISIIGRPELVPYLKGIEGDLDLTYDMDIADRFGLGSDYVAFMLNGIATCSAAYTDIARTSGWPDEMGILGDELSWRETVEDTIDKTAPEYVRRDAIQTARFLARMANDEEIPGRVLTIEETEKLIEDSGFTERLMGLYYRGARELAEKGLAVD